MQEEERNHQKTQNITHTLKKKKKKESCRDIGREIREIWADLDKGAINVNH